MKWLAKIVPVVAIITLMAACGGGTTEEEGVSGAGPTALESVSDLPSLDAEHYDYSYTQPLGSLSKSVVKALPGEVEGFSRSGCEVYTLKKQIIRQSKFPELIKCYMASMEDAAGITIPTGSWGVYQITDMPEEQGPQGAGDSFVIRARKTSSGGIDMDSCLGITKDTELRTTMNPDGGCTIAQTNKSDDYGSFLMAMTLVGACSDSTYTTASFTMSFNDTFGYGSATMTADRASVFNTLSGAMHSTWEGSVFEGRVYSKFGETMGSAKHRGDGEYPASTVSESCAGDQNCVQGMFQLYGFGADAYVCWTPQEDGNWVPEAAGDDNKCNFTDEGAQAFSITTSGNTQTFTVLATDTEGAYYGDVSQSILSDPEEPSIEYTDPWECDATDATPIDIGSLMQTGTPAQLAAFEACMTLEQEMNDFEQGSVCEEQEMAAWNEGQ